jgi:hypothetical protein
MSTNHPLSGTHKRAKSSVLSFMHKRTPSAGAVLSSAPTNDFVASPTYEAMPFLPQDHPHYRALGELQQNHQSQPPVPTKKSGDWKSRPTTSDDVPKPLHKKTLSSISLKTLAGKDKDKATKSKESRPNSPKKPKSSTNLATLLSRPKSSKSLRKEADEEEARAQRDKENQAPSTPIQSTRPPPIYAQFSSEHFAKQQFGGKFLEDEIDLYTPQNYSPGKQRNFYEGPGVQPSLSRRDDGSQRPKSTYLPSSFSIQDISRRVSGGSRHSAELMRRVSGSKRPSFDRNTSGSSTKSDKAEKTTTNRGQRVLAAVTAFGGKPKSPDVEKGPVLEEKDVDREFEAMLDRRNIPEHQRGKMRSLAVAMKKDFIKQDWAEIAAAKKGRPGTNSSDSSADATKETQEAPEAKPKRPRSRTFTLSRASSKENVSSMKKSKELTMGKHSRTNSSSSITGGKSLTSTGTAVAQNIIAKAKGQTPDDFVSYLRKIRKPELVEVGKLHKLRLLLRNETVAWTDDFITQGGMEEVVGLLHRIMEVEWRFVATLPCLKAKFTNLNTERSTKMHCCMKSCSA